MSKKKLSKKKVIGIVLGAFVVISIATNGTKKNDNNTNIDKSREIKSIESTKIIENLQNSTVVLRKESEVLQSSTQKSEEYSHKEVVNSETKDYHGVSYKIIEVDGGNLSAERQPNVAVDVGYGDRVYGAFTNIRTAYKC